jgi:hypothetical protein
MLELRDCAQIGYSTWSYNVNKSVINCQRDYNAVERLMVMMVMIMVIMVSDDYNNNNNNRCFISMFLKIIRIKYKIVLTTYGFRKALTGRKI